MSSPDDAFWDAVAQAAHFFAMYAIAYTAQTKFGWIAYGVAAAMLGVYAVVKEVWYDPKYESAAVVGSGTKDMIYLFAGIITAGLVAWI